MVRVPLHRKLNAAQRVATFEAGSGISLSTTSSNKADEVVLTITATGGGGGGNNSGAPTTSKYVTLATDATLTEERVLTAGNNITITDAGAGGAVTIAATVPSVPSAASSVVSETSFGQSAATGTATAYAREDHTHGTPAVPAHTDLSALAWTSSGHTGSTTAVAAWNGNGAAAAVQATTDETMLVRRAGSLQWVPLVIAMSVMSGEFVLEGGYIANGPVALYTGTFV